MGQAAVDLPDPLDQQPPASPGGMDDLLAQLAGDEIDRLLAEADAEPGVAPANAALTPVDAPVEPIRFDDPVHPQAAPEADLAAPAHPRVSPTPKLSPKSPLAKLNALAGLPPETDDVSFAEAEALVGGAAVAGSDDEDAPVDAETQASLDALTDELDPAGSAARHAAAATVRDDPPSVGGLLAPGAVEKVLADEAAGLIGTKPPAPAGRAVEEDDDATVAAERGALDADVDAEIAAAAAAGPAVSSAAAPPISSRDLNAVLGPADDDAPLPLLLRPLEWLNAPLAACPQSIRDVVGKAAIVTTVNAIAVLVYVVFFRR